MSYQHWLSAIREERMGTFFCKTPLFPFSVAGLGGITSKKFSKWQKKKITKAFSPRNAQVVPHSTPFFPDRSKLRGICPICLQLDFAHLRFASFIFLEGLFHAAVSSVNLEEPCFIALVAMLASLITTATVFSC